MAKQEPPSSKQRRGATPPPRRSPKPQEPALDGGARRALQAAEHLLDARNVNNGAGTEQSTHGCFDNSIDLIGQALGYIVNPKQPVTVKVERLDY